MFITERHFENARKNLQYEPWRTYYEDVKVLSDRLLETDYPPANPAEHGWILFKGRYFTRAVITLAGFYRLTGEEKYAKRAWYFIEDNLKWKDWYYTDSPGDWEFDLTTGEIAFGYTMALSLLEGWLDEEKRSRIIPKLNEKILIPYLQAFDPECFPEKPWWYDYTANWNNVCNGGLLCLALYLSKENDYAVKAIPIALKGLDYYINAMHEDGSSEEGIGYWIYATNFLTYAFLTYEAATGKEHPVFSHTALGKGLIFPFDFSFPAKEKGISFADINTFAPTGILYELAARTGAKDVISELTIRLLDRSRRPGLKPVFEEETYMWPDEIFALLCCTEPYSESAGKAAPSRLFKIYPVNGWGLFKHGKLSLSFRSGSSKVSHGMRDLNAIQLAKDGQIILENMGNHPYPEGWFSPVRGQFIEDQTTSKNSMLINGIGQICYGEATFGSDETSMWSDATSTYPFLAKKILRRAELVDEGIRLTDEFSTDPGTWHESRFITYGEFKKIDNGKWTASNNGATVTLSFSSDKDLYYTVCDVPSSIGVRPAAKMLRVITREQFSDSVITTLITE
jgi:hypothetical protein